MKTKIILHGGESSKRSEENSIFFNTIVNSVKKDQINILCVYFARPEHRWGESFAEDRWAFESTNQNKDVDVQLAERDTFEEQLNWADVIFINGGFKGFLKDALTELPDFRELILGKVLVGISAGANLLGKYYFSQGGNEIREGLGLLNIKIFCHYSPELSEELEMLKTHGEDLPIYKIPEEKFEVLEL